MKNYKTKNNIKMEKEVYVIYSRTGKLFINEQNQMVEFGIPCEYPTFGAAMEIASYWNGVIGYPTFKVFTTITTNENLS